MRKAWELGEVCEHGTLGRQCDTCWDKDTIRQLVEAARAVLRSAAFESGEHEPALRELRVSVAALAGLRNAVNDV